MWDKTCCINMPFFFTLQICGANVGLYRKDASFFIRFLYIHEYFSYMYILCVVVRKMFKNLKANAHICISYKIEVPCNYM